MSDEVRRVLDLVSSGDLSPDEAAPILDELDDERPRPEGGVRGPTRIDDAAAERPGPRHLRIEVTEHGRRVVNLRVPAGLATGLVPGIPAHHLERVRAALSSGTVGRILEILDEDGDGVVIATE